MSLFMFKNSIQDTMINHHISLSLSWQWQFLDILSFNEFNQNQYQNCWYFAEFPSNWLLSDIILMIKLRLLRGKTIEAKSILIKVVSKVHVINMNFCSSC